MVGSLYEDQKVFDVVVRGVPSTTSTPARVADLMIDTPTGEQVRLGDIATVRVVPYPTVIRHDATLRSLDVTAQVRGRDLGAVSADVRGRVSTVPMPLEYHAEVLGGAEQLQTQNLQTAGLAISVGLAIFLLLQAAFGSWRLAALVFLTLPLAAAGSVLAALPVGGIMSLGALIGLFAVLGITVRNSVGLLSSFQRLGSDEAAVPGPESILRAARERSGPVLVAAAATTAILLPLLFFGRMTGAEFLYPLAAVVIGGLVTSTLLTVFVLPALYIRFAAVVQRDGLLAHPATGGKDGASAAGSGRLAEELP
jgi:Cu/Ag efflux pump CusA